MKMLRKSKGFTLIELMIVMAIIGILAMIVIPNVVGYLNRDKYAPKQIEVITQEQEREMQKAPETKQEPEGDKKKL